MHKNSEWSLCEVNVGFVRIERGTDYFCVVSCDQNIPNSIIKLHLRQQNRLCSNSEVLLTLVFYRPHKRDEKELIMQTQKMVQNEATHSPQWYGIKYS